MTESDVVSVLRRMAWQRAKAELFSILETYLSGELDNARQFSRVDTRIRTFAREMEDDL